MEEKMVKTAQCQAVLCKCASSFKLWLFSWKLKMFFQHWIEKTGSSGQATALYSLQASETSKS